MKDLNDKLKRLKVNLYRNTMDEKQSACFGAHMITTINHVIYQNMKVMGKYTDMVHFVAPNVQSDIL